MRELERRRRPRISRRSNANGKLRAELRPGGDAAATTCASSTRTERKRRSRPRPTSTRLQEECGQIYGELPEPHRAASAPSLPADWLATTYPGADRPGRAPRRGGRTVGSAAAIAAGGTGPRRLAQADGAGGLQTPGTSLGCNRNCRPTAQDVRREHARLEAEEKSSGKEPDGQADGAAGIESGSWTADEGARADAGRDMAEVRRRLEAAGAGAAARPADADADADALPPTWQAAAEKVGAERDLRSGPANATGWRRPAPTSAAANCSRPGSTATCCGRTKTIWKRRRRRSPPRRGRTRRRWRTC